MWLVRLGVSPYVPIAAVALLLGSAGGGYWAGRSDGTALANARCATQRLASDTEAAKILRLAQENARAAEAAARTDNEEDMRRANQAAAAADDRARHLERLLHAAQARPSAGGGERPPPADQPGAAGPAGESGSLGEVGEARAAFTGACIRDAERMSALQAQVRRYQDQQADLP